MKVVLFGYYGYGNLGDEGILTALVRHLPQVLPGVELTVLSADPEEICPAVRGGGSAADVSWAVLRLWLKATASLPAEALYSRIPPVA